jgi:hypothetical protein
MEIQTLASGLVQLVREGKSGDAKQKFYADEIISIEGNGITVQGIEAIQKKSKEWGAQIQEMHSLFVSDPIVATDHFAIHMRLDLTYKNGFRGTLDEICVYTVSDGKIVKEQFFFNS